jgi:hypothetical protein
VRKSPHAVVFVSVEEFWKGEASPRSAVDERGKMMSKRELDEMTQEEINAYINLGVATRSMREAGVSNKCVIRILESVVEELRSPRPERRAMHERGVEIPKQYKH